MKTIQRLLARLALILTFFALPAAHAVPGDVDPLDAAVGGGYVLATAVQPDGKTIIAGQFTSVLGQPRNNIARLNADGTLDAGFNPNTNGGVFGVAVQADGRILLGGTFTSVGGTTRNYFARVDADGTLDAGFNPNANSNVYSVVVQADGRILLGGAFTSVGGTTRNYIARVDADGTLDAGFNPNTNDGVFGVAVQADGRILLGGTFTNVGGTTRNCFARLLNDPATQTLSAPDATQVTWTRGGSSPEVSQVTFEKSTDSGATWTPLGSGTRIGTTANWQLTGLALSGSGQFRARGRTPGGGYLNGGSGLVEATASYSIVPPDTVAPDTTIASGPSGTVNSASATFAYSADEASTFTYSLDGGAPTTGAGPVTFNALAQGSHTFSVFATDTAGNVDATPATRTWSVQLDPASTEIAVKGAAVPGAGVSGSGIPAGAVWVSFGFPSINDAGQALVLGTFKAGTVSTTAMLSFNVADTSTMRVVAKKDDAAPGITNAVMSALKEPLLGPDGSVAWQATLANAKGTTGAVLIPIRFQDSTSMIQGQAVSEMTAAGFCAKADRPLASCSRTAPMESNTRFGKFFSRISSHTFS